MIRQKNKTLHDILNKRMCKRYVRLFSIVLLIICLLGQGYPLPVEAVNQNPSLEEIASIFDKVAEEKQVPAEILKALAYHESGWRQWNSQGNVVIGAGRYIGIMQVATPSNTDTAYRLKNDITYNIAYGADILLAKWEMTPKIGDGDRSKLENWYFAIWAYNSWSTLNNPSNAAAAGRTAYQDKILKLINTEYFQGVVSPVKITPIPTALLSVGTLPSKNSSWQTPQPIHYASFAGENSGLSKSEELALLASVNRIYGTDRIDTAVKIAYQGWPHGCETVLISTSDDFPDALAGVALAKVNNAPILLTSQDQLDPRVEQALLTLKPLKVVILGGKTAVSAQVENRLKEILSWTDNIERIAGQDRFETAALIASVFPSGTGIAIASGNNFPDALSLAAAAAAQGIPLLLVAGDNLSEATADVLRAKSPGSLYIAGGEGVIPADLLNEICGASGVALENIHRFIGNNRYDTSVMILKDFYPEVQKIYLATGKNFPDALAGAALAANTNTPMLLVPPEGPAVGSSTERYFESLPAAVEMGVFGGKSAVPDKTVIQLRFLMGKSDSLKP